MRFLFLLLYVILFSRNVDAMAWEIRNKSGNKFNIWFNYDEEIDIVISCDANSLASLDEETKKLFCKVNDEFRYSKLNISYGDVNEEDGKDEVEIPESQKLIRYGSPHRISVEKLAKIIKTQKVIFYTGSGISDEIIPSVDKLMIDLGISIKLQENDNLQKYIAEIVGHPDHYVEIFRNFSNKCDNAKPSVAHQELAKIIHLYGSKFITENTDQLHEKTGLEPFISPRSPQNREFMNNAVTDVDFVITIGLDDDKSGFLKLYKSCNPKGKIISIHFTDPRYLSVSDFSINGDIQKIVKLISKKVCNKTK